MLDADAPRFGLGDCPRASCRSPCFVWRHGGLLSLDISAPVSCEMPRGLMMMGMIPWNFHPRTNTPKSHGDTNKDELLTGR